VADAPSHAATGDNASVVLADQMVVERGDLLCSPDAPPKVTSVFDADVFWLGHGELAAGRRLTLRVGTREVGARVSAVHHVLDDDTFARKAAPSVGEGGVARLTLALRYRRRGRRRGRAARDRPLRRSSTTG
jgi:bifunctional enzyme CysN/CysC